MRVSEASSQQQTLT